MKEWNVTFFIFTKVKIKGLPYELYITIKLHLKILHHYYNIVNWMYANYINTTNRYDENPHIFEHYRCLVRAVQRVLLLVWLIRFHSIAHSRFTVTRPCHLIKYALAGHLGRQHRARELPPGTGELHHSLGVPYGCTEGDEVLIVFFKQIPCIPESNNTCDYQGIIVLSFML